MTRLERINKVIDFLFEIGVEYEVSPIVNNTKDYVFHISTPKGSIYTSGKKVDARLAHFNAVVTPKGITFYKQGNKVSFEKEPNMVKQDVYDYLPF